jgi:hypothetical protein
MAHPATAEPTAPVPVLKGCPSGTVAIIHYPGDWYESTVCIKAGARLRLTLTTGGIGSWDPLQVAPEGAAMVTSTTDSTAMHAIVSPTGKASFCLSTGLMPASPTDPVFSWRLCVTVRR